MPDTTPRSSKSIPRLNTSEKVIQEAKFDRLFRSVFPSEAEKFTGRSGHFLNIVLCDSTHGPEIDRIAFSRAVHWKKNNYDAKVVFIRPHKNHPYDLEQLIRQIQVLRTRTNTVLELLFHGPFTEFKNDKSPGNLAKLLVDCGLKGDLNGMTIGFRPCNGDQVHGDFSAMMLLAKQLVDLGVRNFKGYGFNKISVGSVASISANADEQKRNLKKQNDTYRHTKPGLLENIGSSAVATLNTSSKRFSLSRGGFYFENKFTVFPEDEIDELGQLCHKRNFSVCPRGITTFSPFPEAVPTNTDTARRSVPTHQGSSSSSNSRGSSSRSSNSNSSRRNR